MTEPPRSPIKQTREQFDNIFNLHVKQPWTSRKHDQLYALLGECQTNEETHLVLDLLAAYENFDEGRTETAFKELRDKIVNDWKVDSSKALIVALHNESQPGSSQALIQAFKPYFAKTSWTANAFLSELKPTLGKLSNGMSVILVDDFIGTGGQLEKTLNWYLQYLHKGGVSLDKIYLVSLCIMEQAIPKIVAKKVIHHASHYMKKGLSDRYSGARLAEYIKIMQQLEARLKWKDAAQRQKYSLGFFQSEALFRYMDNNAPNNNFPIFWWKETADGQARSPLQERL